MRLAGSILLAAVIVGGPCVADARKPKRLAHDDVRSMASMISGGAVLRAISVVRKGREGRQVLYLERLELDGTSLKLKKQQLVKARYSRFDQMKWVGTTLHFRMSIGKRERSCTVRMSPTRALPVARCKRWKRT